MRYPKDTYRGQEEKGGEGEEVLTGGTPGVGEKRIIYSGNPFEFLGRGFRFV
jgi:hypothetical protein